VTYPATYGATYTGGVTPLPGGYLPVPPGVSWQAGNGAAVTTLGAFTPDVNGPPNATPWYIPFSGFIERLPQAWDDNRRGVTAATVVDAWWGANFVPQPILIDEIVNDLPYAYWPCTDAAGAQSAANIAANAGTGASLAGAGSLPLVAATSKYGANGATSTFGANGSALLGAVSTVVVSSSFQVSNQAGMWSQTLPNDVFPTTEGYSLTCTDAGFPPFGLPQSGGITIEAWFQVAAPLMGRSSVILAGSAVDRYQFMVVLDASVPNGGTGNLFLLTDRVAATLTTIGHANYQNTSLAPTHVALSMTRTTWTSYVNGVQTGSGTWGTELDPQFVTIEVNGTTGSVFPFPWSGPYSGYTGHVAVFPRILPATRIMTHYQAGITAMAGEPCYYRIERLLQAGNATGRRCILQEPGGAAPGTFTAVVSCQDIPGQPAASSVMNVTGDTLPGLFLIAPTGDMFFLDKAYAFGQPVRWTLGENAAGGEIPYDGDISFDYDPSRVVNEIELTQLDDQSVTVPTVPAVELASQLQYGTISDLATGYLEGDGNSPLDSGPGLGDYANWLACTYRAPGLRLTQVTVDAASNPGSWPFVLGAASGDMTVVNRRSVGAAAPEISVTGRITQTQRTYTFSGSGTAGSLTCIVDAAPEEDALTCDDPVRGQLTGGNILGW
jgi:hypothetical protein